MNKRIIFCIYSTNVIVILLNKEYVVLQLMPAWCVSPSSNSWINTPEFPLYIEHMCCICFHPYITFAKPKPFWIAHHINLFPSHACGSFSMCTIQTWITLRSKNVPLMYISLYLFLCSFSLFVFWFIFENNKLHIWPELNLLCYCQ